MGGVAGAMDQVDSNTLSRLPSGQYGYQPSRRHLDQMQQIIQTNPMQGGGFNSVVPYQQMPVQQVEEDKMDVSKYLGKKKTQPVQQQPNSQAELLKIVLQPINDQLEKICILLGMIYQKLDNDISEEHNYVEPASTPEIDDTIEDNVGSEEEIAELEKKLSSCPKPPSLEELGQINDDPEIDL